MKGGQKLPLAASALVVFALLIILLSPHTGKERGGGAEITLTVNFDGVQAESPTTWTLENGEWAEREGNSSTVVFYNLTADTPYAALEEACMIAGWELHYENYSYGRLVVSVYNRTNGDNGAYWQYWVNDVYASVSSDSYSLSDGDSVVWSFTSSMQEKAGGP